MYFLPLLCSERGFKGFGKHPGPAPEGGRHSSTGSYVEAPSHRKVSSSSDSASVPISSPAPVSKSLPTTGMATPVSANYDAKDGATKKHSAEENTTTKYGISNEMMEVRRELIRRGEEHFVEKSSDDGSQCTSEDLDESFSDDEVFLAVIVNRKYPGAWIV